MDAEDYLICRHESGHVAAGLLLGHRVTRCARYGQHGILKGHGVTDFEYRADATLAEKLVPLIAGIFHEPFHANSDARQLATLRDSHPGANAIIAEANELALKMVQTQEFRRLALQVERALYCQPVLREEDVLALS